MTGADGLRGRKMNADGKYALTLTLLILSIAAAYILRLVVKGRARFERTDRHGGSWLLGKGVMELGYWGFLPAAQFLASMQISPNQVSWASLAFGFAAGACLSVGHFGFAAVCAALSSALDCLDGMVARITKANSDAGALLGSFMVSYSSAKAEAMNIEPPRGNMRRPERAVYLDGGAMLSAITIPWLEAPPAGAVPIGYPMLVALAIVAVAANISAVARLWSIARALRAREEPRAKTLEEPTIVEAVEPRRSAGMEHSR